MKKIFNRIYWWAVELLAWITYKRIGPVIWIAKKLGYREWFGSRFIDRIIFTIILKDNSMRLFEDQPREQTREPKK